MVGSKYYKKILVKLKGFSMDGLGSALKLSNMMEIGLEGDDPLEYSVVQGCFYLECKCSAVYGFQVEVSRRKDMSNASLALPTNFDSAFLLPFLQSIPINPSVISSITNMLESRRNPNNGFWNYSYFKGLVPDDVDTISTILMALLCSNKMSEGECRAEAQELLKATRRFEDGVLDMYLHEPQPTEITETIVEKRRLDIGTFANTMWLLGRLGLDTMGEVEPTLRLLDGALDDLLSCTDFDTILPNCKHYTSQHVLCFLLSRVVAVSSHAEKCFKGKLTAAVKSRLNSSCPKNSDNPLDIGCSILAALNLGMENNPDDLYCILQQAKLLLGMQCDNGSFPTHYLYEFSHPVELYFGSPAVTTAISVAALSELSRKVRNASSLLVNGFQGHPKR